MLVHDAADYLLEVMEHLKNISVETVSREL